LPVKRSQSATRVLCVLESVARHQPIGVSELARLLGEDKSAVQRAIMTLADEGWIAAAPGATTRWQVTARILAVAHVGHLRHDLRQRARGRLEALRDESGETVLLTVPDTGRFVVIDAVESRQVLRTVPHLGLAVPARGSATGRAILPYMTGSQRHEFLSAADDAKLQKEFAATRERGYSVSVGDVAEGSTNIAAPVFELDGHAAAAVVVSAPSERLAPDRHVEVGAMVRRAAHELSRGAPAQAAQLA